MMRTRMWQAAGAAALSLLFMIVLATPSYAPHANFPKDGCTPGYWKNHHEAWTGSVTVEGVVVPLTPTTTLGTIFTALTTATYAGSSDPALNSLSGTTLSDALGFPGGPGLAGAARILLREAVAGILNAAHPTVIYGGFGLTNDPNQIRTTVNGRLREADRDRMLDMASRLDAANNQGCPLG